MDRHILMMDTWSQKSPVPSSAFADIANEFYDFLLDAGAVTWGSEERFSGKTVEEWIQYDLKAYQDLGAKRPFARSVKDGIGWQKNNLSQIAFAMGTGHATQIE